MYSPAAKLQTSFPEVLASNLGWETGYPEDFIVFVDPSWQMPRQYLD
jgi:hypothetical protein